MTERQHLKSVKARINESGKYIQVREMVFAHSVGEKVVAEYRATSRGHPVLSSSLYTDTVVISLALFVRFVD